MGYLTKFLRQAVWDAIDGGRKQIALEHLAVAHESAVWRRAELSDISRPLAEVLFRYRPRIFSQRSCMWALPSKS